MLFKTGVTCWRAQTRGPAVAGFNLPLLPTAANLPPVPLIDTDIPVCMYVCETSYNDLMLCFVPLFAGSVLKNQKS